METEHIILLGDLVYYVGPPVLNPLRWSYIVENNNGIISTSDLGVVIETDSFLRIANIFFQRQEITLERVSFKQLRIAE
jgi:hypothetical protein